MYKILIYDSSPLDLAVSAEILNAGLSNVTIFTMDSIEQANYILDQEAFDLLIVDMPRGGHLEGNFLKLAQGRRPGLTILLTSVIKEEELDHLLMKWKATAYLLKPFRSVQLLAAVTSLMAATVQADEKAGLIEQRAYLAKLDTALMEYSYQNCLEVIHDYLDYLYQYTNNLAIIRVRILGFAEGMAALKMDLGPELHGLLAGSLERFRTRFDFQGKQYEVRVILERMLDAIFEAMEQAAFCETDTLKKALNYIDRNIKKGIKLDDAADYVNMSASYFSKIFKHGTGVNFIDYISERKIECAQEILKETDMPISNIAFELSFRDANYFSKVFKKKTGQTPREYREQ